MKLRFKGCRAEGAALDALCRSRLVRSQNRPKARPRKTISSCVHSSRNQLSSPPERYRRSILCIGYAIELNQSRDARGAAQAWKLRCPLDGPRQLCGASCPAHVLSGRKRARRRFQTPNGYFGQRNLRADRQLLAPSGLAHVLSGRKRTRRRLQTLSDRFQTAKSGVRPSRIGIFQPVEQFGWPTGARTGTWP